MSQGFATGYGIDTDPTLAANSDLLVASQKAIKTYVSGAIAATADGDKGDISVSGSGAVWTIDADTVTRTKLDSYGRSAVDLFLATNFGAL